MAKEIIKAAGRAALESTLQQLLPTMLKRFDDLQQQILNLQQQMLDLRKHMDEKFEAVNAKFERTQEVINELGLRVNGTGVKVDTFLEFSRRDSAKVDIYLERLVRLEEGLKSRRRRAG